jgi:hypothetical protein
MVQARSLQEPDRTVSLKKAGPKEVEACSNLIPAHQRVTP